tara:strand:+ start:2068 stop:3399 length:1332 start_codon:yes stop_codon:yes gene_type:complete
MSIRLGNKKFAIGTNKTLIYNDDSGRFAVDYLENFRNRNGSFKDYRGNLVKGPQFLGRVDYEGRGGAVISESSFTNENPHSEELTNGHYTASNMTVSLESLSGPDKDDTMRTFKLHNSNANARFSRTYGVSSNRQVNHSLFVKAGNTQYVGFKMVTNVGDSYAIYNIQEGKVEQTAETSTDVQIKAKIISYKDDWYRIAVAFKEVATTGTNRFDFLVLNSNDITSVVVNKYCFATGYQKTHLKALNSYLPTYDTKKTFVDDRYKRDKNMRYWLPNNTNNSQYGITFTVRASVFKFDETSLGFISIGDSTADSDSTGTGHYIALEATLKINDPVIRWRMKTSSNNQSYGPNMLTTAGASGDAIETIYHFGITYTGTNTWLMSVNGSTQVISGTPTIDTGFIYDTFSLAQPSGNKFRWNGRVYAVNILDKPSTQAQLNALTAQNL